MRIALFTSLFCVGSLTAADPGTNQAIERIRSLGREGTGNKEAALAWREIVAVGPDALLPLLNNYDEASPVSRNWLRMAVDAIVEKPLPKEELAGKFEGFILDARKGPESRKLAYDALKKIDAPAIDRMLPKLLADRNVGIRRDAIAARLGVLSLTKLATETQKKVYGELFDLCRDEDQVDTVAKKLKDLGVETDLQKHFGIVAQMRILGPFDSQEGKAYAIPLPPESRIELDGKFEGKDKSAIEWKTIESKDIYGVMDINKALGKFKNAVCYAYFGVESDKDQTVDFRFGSLGAVRVFLNGQEVFASEEFHHGVKQDQYIVKAKLKAGKNAVLMKLLQNNQTEVWAQDWKFQARLCDDTGGAVNVKTSISK